MSKRALIMAGGTGGHIFPGLAVAKELQNRGWEIEWLGSKDGMEEDLVAKHGIKVHSISVSGLRGKGIVKLLTGPFILLKAVAEARAVLKHYKPHVVVGLGGFASGPGGIAARLANKALVIHEQNAIAGMTNRYLAKFASKVLAAFPKALENADVIGNPVRSDFANVTPMTEQRDGLNILVVGGSRGAKALNEFMPALVERLSGLMTISCKHQVGKNNLDNVETLYKDVNQLDKVEICEFIDDMVAAYEWADIVICRAGALTVSEVATAGRMAIFVPFPFAVDDHQTKNAAFLVEQNAAICIQQEQLNVEELAKTISELSREKLVVMAQNAKLQSQQNALNLFADSCEEVARVE